MACNANQFITDQIFTIILSAIGALIPCGISFFLIIDSMKIIHDSSVLFSNLIIIIILTVFSVLISGLMGLLGGLIVNQSLQK